MQLKITQISVIKDGTRANLPCNEIITNLELFRSEMRDKYEADKILFCIEEIENK